MTQVYANSTRNFKQLITHIFVPLRVCLFALMMSALSACATSPRLPIAGRVVDDKDNPMDTVAVTLKEYVVPDAQRDPEAGWCVNVVRKCEADSNQNVVPDKQSEPDADVYLDENEERKCKTITDQQGRYRCNSLEGSAFRVGKCYQLILRKNAFKEGRFLIKYPPEGAAKVTLYDMDSNCNSTMDKTNEKPQGGSGKTSI